MKKKLSTMNVRFTPKMREWIRDSELFTIHKMSERQIIHRCVCEYLWDYFMATKKIRRGAKK